MNNTAPTAVGRKFTKRKRGWLSRRTIEYSIADFEGDAVAGRVERRGDRRSERLCRVRLAGAHRLHDRYGDFTRNLEDVGPLPISATFSPTGKGVFSGTFTGGELIDATETWTWTAANGDARDWTNGRQRIATHAPLGDGLHNLLFGVFGGFIDREEIGSLSRSRGFSISAAHNLFDPTDFEFLPRQSGRAARDPEDDRPGQPGRNALTQSRIPPDAGREKRHFFDADMHARHINGAGKISASTGEGEDLVFHDDMSSMLWTGVYSAARRYAIWPPARPRRSSTWRPAYAGRCWPTTLCRNRRVCAQPARARREHARRLGARRSTL
jgi:hypothetical protein